MPVLGMGGYFFRAKNPEALKAWYREHLGVGGGMGVDESAQSNDPVWFTHGGPMVFEPFAEGTDYIPAEKQSMINLRVSDLDGLLASLRAAGIEVITRSEWDVPELGRFARVHDPEGNAIELWEPAPVRRPPVRRPPVRRPPVRRPCGRWTHRWRDSRRTIDSCGGDGGQRPRCRGIEALVATRPGPPE